MKTLNELRTEIDQIDYNLVQLFEKRMNIVIQVAEYKLHNGIPVLNAGREQAVLEQCCSFLHNEEFSDALTEWMKFTMALSRREQENFLATQKLT